VAIAALLCAAGGPASAQQADTPETPKQQQPAADAPRRLPQIEVEAKRQQPKRRKAAPVVAAVRPQSQPDAGVPAGDVPSDRAGTVGYLGTQTSTATKTATRLINVPQSVSILTKEFIRDQNFQNLTDSLRYVPGVIPHQGEGNRDQIVIRGQSSSADFFVNGIRDDVQYYRDFFNIARVEVLKGPNAMIFGRGGGGGIVNRVTKEADGTRIREMTVGGGSFYNARTTVDIGDRINEHWAARLNAVYERSDSYRDYVNLERYGVNPTFTYRPNADTKVQFSYEFFQDHRVADRGIPSQAGTFPALPFNTLSLFFGHPNLNRARIDAHIAYALFEHDFGNGLHIKNVSQLANYDKFYQNIFPGGPVNAAGTAVPLTAYNNTTPRTNLFNQTDLTYKLETGAVRQTLLVGTEVGDQRGRSERRDGFFPGNVQTLVVSPQSPATFVPVEFRNIPSGAFNRYNLKLAAAYMQDQIEITRYLQIIGGIRFDQFNLDSTDMRTDVTLNRVDNLLSPRIGAIVKPMESLALYASYSVSYLPSSGDQFSTLNPGTLIAEPEKFVNKEVGLKWEISPRLQFLTAVYNLNRFNQRLADPNNPGFFILSGRTETNGFEASLVGYLTDEWQVYGGYAYTDARIASATSTPIVAGNRVGLVPYNTFSLWNKYQITPLWAAGVGVIHQTGSYASSDDTVLLPGWTRVDAAIFGEVPRYMLSPDIKRLRWQVNVENIFNTRYNATADGNNNITPGSPIAVRGLVIANF
jgi:catecholate siderophore receptor